MTGYARERDSTAPGADEDGRGVLLRMKVMVAPLALTGPALALGIVNLAWALSRPPGPRRPPTGIERFLALDSERNLATWYGSTLLLLVCILLAVICAATRASGGSRVWHWGVLSATFAFLSLDEAVSLHERTMAPLREMLGTSGWLYWAWVIPASVLVLVFGLAYLPFLARLPARSRGLFVLSGLLYVGGALGVEMLTGQIQDTLGGRSVWFALATILEEMLEMAGAILLIYALLDYAGRRWGSLSLQLGGGGPLAR